MSNVTFCKPEESE